MDETVVTAILWDNGMVSAFDERGQQVPKYQGPKDEILPVLKRDYPNLQIQHRDWESVARHC